MKNTARRQIEQHLLERAQVRTIGAIRPLRADAKVRLDALAQELGLTVDQIATLPELADMQVSARHAISIIESALDRLAEPDRVLWVHAQREFDDMVYAIDLATWIGVPLSEIWFHTSGGWDSVWAAAENEDIDDYDIVEEGIAYAQLAATYENSAAAWEAFDSFAGVGENAWVGYVDAVRLADDLGVELPWAAKAIIAAMEAEE